MRTKRIGIAAVLASLAITVAACSSDDSASDVGATGAVGTVIGSSAPTDTAVARSAEAPTTDSSATTDPATTAPTTTAPTTTAPEDEGFTIPADRVAELEAAGYGWLLDVEYPDQPADVAWPTQEWPRGELPADVDRATVDAIAATAFASVTNPDGTEAGNVEALLVVHGGEIVFEQYNGWEPTEAHVSWSMAKSITQALLGVLVADGGLDPFAPAPVPEWADPADERHAITIDEMLHMRSGLQWQEEYAGTSDVITMLFGEGSADRAAYAAAKPLDQPIDSVFSYSTGTSMILARVVADQVGYGDAGTAWADEVLFAPLGITSVVHDLDDTGAMSGGSNINMTAQDFARFGLLYLRGGEWDGERIVPESWVDYARLPRADVTFYGAHWWPDVGTAEGTSSDGGPMSFSALGFAGQSITVVPSEDLVVVALANTQDDRSDVAASALVDAFSGS
jgi:CubicO group peptidase (beta-lactamase class C family)